MPQLTHPQRQLLQHFAPRLSQSVIAKYLGVHRSTISRELKRYSINGVYNAMYASFARKQKRAIANGLMMRTGMRYGLVSFYKKISMRLPNPYRFWGRRVRPACLTYTSVDTSHNVGTLHATSVPICKPDQTDNSIKTSVSNEPPTQPTSVGFCIDSPLLQLWGTRQDHYVQKHHHCASIGSYGNGRTNFLVPKPRK